MKIVQVIKENRNDIIKTLALALIMSIVICTLFVKAYIPSGSMENTLMPGDIVWANRITYKISGINRGDIMIFYPPDLKDSGDDTMYIKRVIGLPGETIEGKDGYVYIDGEKLEESYVMNLLDSDFGPYTIPEDSYFMMGDNRSGSFDSRYWENKFVNIDNFIARASVRYIGGFKVFSKQEYNIQ
jgi:signal peptidase I